MYTESLSGLIFAWQPAGGGESEHWMCCIHGYIFDICFAVLCSNDLIFAWQPAGGEIWATCRGGKSEHWMCCIHGYIFDICFAALCTSDSQ